MRSVFQSRLGKFGQKSLLLFAALISSISIWADQIDQNPTPKPQHAIGMQLVPDATFMRTAKGELAMTYHVHVPKNYDPESPPRPLLIAFSPGGNGLGIVDKLKVAVSEAGWLLVGCDQLRNGMHNPELAMKMENEVLNDILANIPHDPKRLYLGGFSGGAMRSYELTTRRAESVAGILAYGGWLGGPDYQDEPYRKNMAVAMINGTRDRGANGWMPIDTKTLRARDCSVKHFTFQGGHTVAPPEITAAAIAWLEKEHPSTDSPAKADTKKIPLDILYVGSPGSRTEQFKKFLSKHFRSVTTTPAAKLTLADTNRADVLLLDEVVRTLPEGCTKAMLLIGSNAAMTGERYGWKIDWLCQCLDNEAYAVNTEHAIFQGPLPVTPTLVEKRCPHSKLKIQAWKVEEPQETSGLVSSRRYFENARDSEIISGGVNMKGVHGVPLVREAHRLLWGFIAPPEEMTEEGRRVFINALTWIHQFDGHQQTSFRGIHPRDTVTSVLQSPYVKKDNLIRWFPQDLLEKTNYDKDELRKHFEGNLPYVFVPEYGGQLRVDLDAQRLQTPNNKKESLSKWIALLDGEESKLAKELLYRYTGQRIRGNKAWKTWVNENKDHLVFRDQEGYRFYTPEQLAARKDPFLKKNNNEEPQELTDLAPILFDLALVGVHELDGVTHQFRGRTVTLTIQARVKEGWHFYSATEDNGTNKPTKITLTLPEGMSFASEWKTPKAKDGKLAHGARFERDIHVGKKPIDLSTIKGLLEFQACTETKCLLPQSLDFELPLTVMER